MTETESLVVLNAIEGVGNKRIRTLLDCYGSAKKIISLSGAELANEHGLPSKIIQNIIHFPKDNFLKNEYNDIIKNEVRIVTFNDKDYPARLAEIPDSPVVLYVKGRALDKEGDKNSLSIAIVGSRKCSDYGKFVAEDFARHLAEIGITVVSGMARGIDTAAHKGALRASGHTLAVMGCGFMTIYPAENRQLFQDIARTGAVISEFSMQTQPFPFNFPRRNRIVSGLSYGVIIVEAANRSGALITADCALEQGREVYAVPGRVDSPASSGVNNLIKQGAKLVTCIEDIIEDLKPQLTAGLKDVHEISNSEPIGPQASSSNRIKALVNDLSDQEKLVYENVNETPVHIDELTGRCQSNMAMTSSVLLQLEIKKLVRQLPGKFFAK